jgi:hypothetical protein
MDDKAIEPVRPATDEYVQELTSMCVGLEGRSFPDKYNAVVSLERQAPKAIPELLARLSAEKAWANAASEMCRDLQASVDGMARERLALEQRIQELEARENG